MMVTFVAQCEKKALNKTRRVLDAFANRIGSRTWQTVITLEGLKAVKKLLRQTASKNSAVSCHWLRSRSRSELVWIVGNRSKFNEEGVVPVNSTEQDIINTQLENNWHYLPLIKSLVALAGLFHDWGKSSDFFQTKLKKAKVIGDPLRHEWLSILFIKAFVGNETDKQWLARLSRGELDSASLTQQVVTTHETLKHKNKPLADLPPVASTLAWLIVSHHRLPLLKGVYEGIPAPDFKVLFNVLSQQWGYENKFDDFDENLHRCFQFPNGLPCDSPRWRNFVKNKARTMLTNLQLHEKSIQDGSWRLILHHSRLSLMLADHNHSSLDRDPGWQAELALYANTDRKTGKLKQRLDEHLFNVAKIAASNAHLLPAFENTTNELGAAYDVKLLKQKSPIKYQWQDKAVWAIKLWRKKHGKKINDCHFGFFTVNMASTGEGKTFANAKIMRSLSADMESLRYILALGLRTLTLQTGDEYRDKIGLGEDELAVLIGSQAVTALHDRNKQPTDSDIFTGSESDEDLWEHEIIFDSVIPEGNLSTVLPDKKSRKLLYAPVLSCTIDHLMAATETKRGGRFILPALRLMSSDLVIDEIDDFDGKDLIAIGRLIHLAGMLGRKVMISSATIPPDLAEGYFNAYQIGWSIFAAMRERSFTVGCGWVDEFGTTVHDISCTDTTESINQYRSHHQKFTNKRLAKLFKQMPKRQANIHPCPNLPEESEQTITDYFFKTVKNAILEKHQGHHCTDHKTGKQVSFGVVRVANITPCIELTKFLLNAKMPDNVEIRTMAYHSQQILIMRNEQEKHLDAVLKRKNGEQASFDQKVIRQHLHTITAQHVIFVLVATPVEEVGRDHDFDWAVIEPSSYRSFIQLAGRVRRHRTAKLSNVANIALLQHNLKGLFKDDRPVFCRPGYESNKNHLTTHDLQDLVDAKILEERLDASLRISKKSSLHPQSNLVDLEHEVIHQLLTNYDRRGPETMQGWFDDYWWLTGLPQVFVKFRAGHPQLPIYLTLQDGVWKFVEKVKYKPPIIVEETYGITYAEELSQKEQSRLWLHRDYETLLRQVGKENINDAALIYGEIGLPTYGRDNNDLSFIYSNQLGLLST